MKFTGGENALYERHLTFDQVITLTGVNLYVMYGAFLPDPHGLLHGEGNQGRFIRLESVAQLDEPAVKELLRAAVRHGRRPLSESGRGYTVVKSVSAKQRPRRAVEKRGRARR